MSKKIPNPKKAEIEKAYQHLHNEYQILAAKYGDSLLKIRYWNEQKEMLEKQIDELGDRQKALEAEMQKEPGEVDAPSGDGSTDQAEASASNG